MNEALLGAVNLCIFIVIVILGVNGVLDVWLINLTSTIILYKWVLITLIPVIFRMFLIYWYWPLMKTGLTEAERESDSHRGMLLTMSGFSFSAFFALVIAASNVDKSKVNLETSLAFMLVSFICFYGAFLLEAYKFTRFRDEIAIALNDTAKLSLLISIALVVINANFSCWVEVLVFVTTFGLWTVDFTMRLSLRVRYLSAKKRYTT